jgi:hypothetical protein
MKLASKKGKTFADVAKPIQNLIEKLKDKPQSQAVKNTQMLLEKQLDDLFRLQEESKPQAPQAPQDMNQMIQNPQEEMMEGMPQQEDPMGMMMPQMRFGGLKTYDGLQPYPSTVIKENTTDPFRKISNQYDPYLVPNVNTSVSPYDVNSMRNAQGDYENYLNKLRSAQGEYENQLVNNNTPPVDTPKTTPNNNWGEVGALATGMAGMAQQIRNIPEAPGAIQRVYLGNGPRPNLPDFTNEKNQVNADAAAIREAIKLGGGNQGANLSRNWAQQLEGRGKIASEEAIQKNAILNAYNDRVANLGAESQKINLGVDTSNRDTRFGYDQMVNAQKNAAIANATQLGADVFNNRTKYSNQLEQAQIMANAHNKSVWTDVDGNKYATGANGEPVKLFSGSAKTTPAATPANTAPAANNTTPAPPSIAPPAVNNSVAPKIKTNINRNKTVAPIVNPNVAPSTYAPLNPYTLGFNRPYASPGDGSLPFVGDPYSIKRLTVRPLNTGANIGLNGYADGGNVYHNALQQQIQQPTINNAQTMDAEYQQHLDAGDKKFKSSITGLEYKVMPRSEKDLYVANMWKDAHGTAPTKKQVDSTKKEIDNDDDKWNQRPIGRSKAKTVAEIVNGRWDKPSYVNDSKRTNDYFANLNTDNSEIQQTGANRGKAYINPETGNPRGELETLITPENIFSTMMGGKLIKEIGKGGYYVLKQMLAKNGKDATFKFIADNGLTGLVKQGMKELPRGQKLIGEGMKALPEGQKVIGAGQKLIGAGQKALPEAQRLIGAGVKSARDAFGRTISDTKFQDVMRSNLETGFNRTNDIITRNGMRYIWDAAKNSYKVLGKQLGKGGTI